MYLFEDTSARHRGRTAIGNVACDEVTDEDQSTQFEAAMSTKSGRFLGLLYRDTSGTRESS